MDYALAMRGLARALSADWSRGGWLILLLASTASLLLWAVLDNREPDDHDGYYTGDVLGALTEMPDAPVGQAVSRFARFIWRDSEHPPVASVMTWATLTVGGRSRLAFRLATLPFLLMLVAGTTWAGWELLGRRWGILAGAVVGGLPTVINASRKADYVFHLAGVTALGLAVALTLLVRRPRAIGTWVLLGVLCGLRLETHALSLPSTVATFGAIARIGGNVEPAMLLRGAGTTLLAPLYGYMLMVFLYEPLAAAIEGEDSGLGAELEE